MSQAGSLWDYAELRTVTPPLHDNSCKSVTSFSWKNEEKVNLLMMKRSNARDLQWLTDANKTRSSTSKMSSG